MSEARTTEPGATNRRVLLAGAGAIGAGVVLSACGGDATGGDGAGEGATDATSAAPGRGDDSRLTGTGDVPVGGGVILASRGVLVTQPAAGTFRAFSAVCTHQSCPIAGIDGGSITCTCHGSSFSIEDGSVRTGPATEPLPRKEIKVDGDSIRLV